MNDINLLDVILGTLVTVVGYLLKRKDDDQAAMIEDLYMLHREDIEKLHQLEIKIAADHYVKAEMDSKFDKLETAMKSGFTTLGTKFDVLSSTLVAHRTQSEINNLRE